MMQRGLAARRGIGLKAIRPRSVDRALLVGFLEEEFGEGHYVTSLVRYLVTARDLADRQMAAAGLGPPPSSPGEDASGIGTSRYRLSDSAAILGELHDCPAILEFMADHADDPGVEVPSDLLSQRADRVIVYTPPRGAMSASVEMFTINGPTRRLLEQFTRPRFWAESVVAIRPGRREDDGDLSDLRDRLVAQGVLCSS